MVNSRALKVAQPTAAAAAGRDADPTSPFGLRVSPLSGSAGEFRRGQDFAAPCGTRVYAADAAWSGQLGGTWGGGNRVEVDHENGLTTTHNHLQAIAVKKGKSVEVGEAIVKVGTTGSSTGCHVHFETSGMVPTPTRYSGRSCPASSTMNSGTSR